MQACSVGHLSPPSSATVFSSGRSPGPRRLAHSSHSLVPDDAVARPECHALACSPSSVCLHQAVTFSTPVHTYSARCFHAKLSTSVLTSSDGHLGEPHRIGLARPNLASATPWVFLLARLNTADVQHLHYHRFTVHRHPRPICHPSSAHFRRSGPPRCT